MTATVTLIRGVDESLVGAALTEATHHLVGPGDRGLMVDEFDAEVVELGVIVDAARTPPFLTERRVVVVRNLRHLFPRGGASGRDDESDGSSGDEEADGADDADGAEEASTAAGASRPRAEGGTLGPLLAYLADPLDSTDLVLEAIRLAPPRALLDAVKKAGGTVVDTNVKSSRDRVAFVEEHLADSGLRLDAAARAFVAEHLGEDLARLDSLIEVLSSAFGPGARLARADVEPFLGEAGGVPPWDLTDAIDDGNTERALGLLTRMLSAGERHPLQVMAILHGHYVRLLRLDGSGVHSEADAATLLKVAPFAAAKALRNGRRLGHEGVVKAIALLARADLDLRGERDLPAEVVMEVLVARLARLAPPAKSTPGRRPG